MKKLVCTLALVLPFLVSQAQDQQMKVVYEEQVKIDLEGKIDDEAKQMPGMEEMMKKLQEKASKSKKVLVINGQESLYRKFDAEQDSEASWTSSSGDVEIEMVVMRPESKVYYNAAEKTLIEQQNFMGKLFLIQEKGETLKWKLTGETMEVAGYQCQKAVAKRDTTTIEVWFTPEIPVSSGPMNLNGLPGLVLKAVINDGFLTITATEIKKEEHDEAVEAPSKGKKMSRKQFQKIRAEKMKEMQEMNGGRGGRMHIQIDRN